MTNYTIYNLDGNSAFNMILETTDIKIKDLKEYLSEYYGVETNDIKLFIRFTKTNQIFEKTDGIFFNGIVNRYLFTINPYYLLDHKDTIKVEDSIEFLLKDFIK